MEPLTALGLAGNVIQFIDYAQKLVSGSKELYQSTTGLTKENDILDVITNDVLDISSKIADDSRLGPSDAEMRLKRLAEECKNLAHRIVRILDDLKRNTGAKNGKWQSFVHLMRSMRKSAELRRLAENVQKIQAQLNLHLTYIISDPNSQVLKVLRRLEEHALRMKMNTFKDFRQLRTDMLECIRATRGDASLGGGDVKAYFNKLTNLKSVSDSNIRQVSARLEQLTSQISTLVSESGLMARQQDILSSLQYRQINDRLDLISDNTTKTFNWIFQTSGPKQNGSLPFLDWLCHKSGTFFVVGKAGSGKSTFMKYLYHHHKTRKHLLAWSGSKRLVTAQFYFWNPGTALQKSQEGLLRSLLLEILKQCPQVVTTICEPYFYKQNVSGQGISWTMSNLKLAFAKLQQQYDLDVKFAFFIDGLDEYDGEYSDLIELLQEFTANPNVKICVSSRPYYVFEDAFGADGRRLQLEAFNEDDIREFVGVQFAKNSRFSQLCKIDGRYEALIQEVVNKAQGVFLWVVLVVRSLMRGFTNDDDIPELQKRLGELPESLEALFRQMFERIDPVYREQTAQIFLIALTAPGLSLTVLSLISNGDVQNVKDTKTFEEEIGTRHLTMRRRLNGRCDGLLEVNAFSPDPRRAFFESEVVFMHRSVRDFLRLEDMQKMLLKRAGPFEAREALARGLLVQLRVSPLVFTIGEEAFLPEYVAKVLEDIAYFVHEIESHNGERQTALLDEVEVVLENSGELVPRWLPTESPFICVAIRYDLGHWIEDQISRRPYLLQQLSETEPLLLNALTNGLSGKFPTASPNIAITRMLLSKGASLQTEYRGMSVWAHFICHIKILNCSFDLSERNNLLIVTRLLISYGADLNELIPKEPCFGDPGLDKTVGNKHEYVAAVDILTNVFGIEEVEDMKQLAQRPS